MALYHFSVTQVKRSEGHTAIAAAAYRSGEKLYDRYYGEIQDYTKKEGVVESFIMLPTHVPKRLTDRETLWYEVESQENRKDAQLAYSFDIALQNELTLEENREVLTRFLNENFVARGMICDVAIHNPPREAGEDPNIHAHILSPVRPFLEIGEWGAKRYHILVFDEDGNPVLNKKGKQKVTNPFTTDWGEAATLQTWRENWEHIVNEKFGEKGLSCRIDHRSNVDRGLDDIPQVHEGSAVRRMEKRGIVTHKGSWNRWVKKTNDNIHRLLSKIRELVVWIAEAKEAVRRIENPTITDMVMQYYEHRDEVAEGYARGTRKAKKGNLQMTAELIAYIERHELTDIDSLEDLINKKNEELTEQKDGLQAKKDEVKELKKNLRLLDDYYAGKPINDEMNRIFFKGKRKEFQDAHRSELNRFQKAKRLLKEMGHEEADFDIVKDFWTERIEFLNGEIATETKTINNSALKKEVKILSEIKEAVDFATKDDDDGDGDGNGSGGSSGGGEAPLPEIPDTKKEQEQATQEQARQAAEQQMRQQAQANQSASRERVSMKKKLTETTKIVDEWKENERVAREQGLLPEKKRNNPNLS